jgi:trigger factor
MFCANCGEKVPESIRFCPSCGARIVKLTENEDKSENVTERKNESEMANPPINVPVEKISAPAPVLMVNEYEEPVRKNPELYNGEYTEDDKKNIKRYIVMIVFGLLVMVCSALYYARNSLPFKDETGYENNRESASTVKKSKDNSVVEGVSTWLNDCDAEKYVTIGDYEGVEVKADKYYFTDEDVEDRFNTDIESYIAENGYDYTISSKKVVEYGDIVKIDYVGMVDGVEYDEISGNDIHLEIGSSNFPDEFQSGLLGYEVGETVFLNLVMEEDYYNEALAGKNVTFEVTIKSIDIYEMPEITDELIQKFDIAYNSISEVKEAEKNAIQQECDDENDSARNNAVWDVVYATCSVKKPPQNLIDDAYEENYESYQSYADMLGVTMDEFMALYGLTSEEFESAVYEYAEEQVKEYLAVVAFAKENGISLSKKEVKSLAEENYVDYGYNSADDMLKATDLDSYYGDLLRNKVAEYLASKVTITYNEETHLYSDADE